MFTVFTNTQLIQNEGMSIGDTNLHNNDSAGLLYPNSYGKYFTLDTPVKMSEIEDFTAIYKAEMRKKWAEETGGDLSQSVHESIDKINSTNIAGFLFRNSMISTFGSAREDDWLYLKIVASVKDASKVALNLQGDATQWDKDEWDEKYCNMPPFMPESEAIAEMRENLKYVSTKGHMFLDNEEKRHFILDDAYKSLFETEMWRKKKNNDFVYMALILGGTGLEKQEFKPKTNDYLYPVE